MSGVIDKRIQRKKMKELRKLKAILDWHDVFCKKEKNKCTYRKKLEKGLKKEKGKLK